MAYTSVLDLSAYGIPRRSSIIRPMHRFHPFRSAAAGLVLFALSGCLWDTPLTPREDARVGEVAFGRSALVWFTDDSAGGGSMKPVLNGAHVYFEREVSRRGGTYDSPSQLIALGRGTGAEAWASPMTAAHNAAVAGGRVGAVWGSLVIVDPATGARRHQYIVPQTTLNTNVATDGARFYAATHDGRAVAVDPATGATVWETELAGGRTLSGFGVSVAGEAVAVSLKYFAWRAPDVDSGFVAVLDRGTGALRWRARIQGAADPGVVEAPQIVGDVVIAVTQGHDVRAYDLQTGALRWQLDASFASADTEYGSRGLASCDGMVIVPTGNLGVVALDAATGAVRWRLGDLGEGSLYSLQCSHGTVLTLGAGLRVFDARTGQRLAAYPRDEPVTEREFWINSVVRDADHLYVGTTYGFAKVRAP